MLEFLFQVVLLAFINFNKWAYIEFKHQELSKNNLILPLTAGLKNIALGIKHPFDDSITGIKMYNPGYNYNVLFTVTI